MKHVIDTGFTFSGFPYWSMDIQGEVALGCPGWLPEQAERYYVTHRAAWCPLPASASLEAWRLDLQQQYTGSYPTALSHCLQTGQPPHTVTFQYPNTFIHFYRLFSKRLKISKNVQSRLYFKLLLRQYRSSCHIYNASLYLLQSL